MSPFTFLLIFTRTKPSDGTGGFLKAPIWVSAFLHCTCSVAQWHWQKDSLFLLQFSEVVFFKRKFNKNAYNVMRQLSWDIFLVSWSWISYLKCLLSFNFTKHKGHGNLLTAFKKVLASFVSFFNSKKDRCQLNPQMAPQAIWLPGFLLTNWQNLRPAKAFSLETAGPGRCKYVEILAKH